MGSGSIAPWRRKGIESRAVDPASIAISRRKKRAKTDRINGEALVRALLAYKRGEPRVCSMVRPPSPEEEDRRWLVRECKALILMIGQTRMTPYQAVTCLACTGQRCISLIRKPARSREAMTNRPLQLDERPAISCRGPVDPTKTS